MDPALSLAEKAGLFSLAITPISLRAVFPHSGEAQEPCLAFLPEPSPTHTVSCWSWGKPFPAEAWLCTRASGYAAVCPPAAQVWGSSKCVGARLPRGFALGHGTSSARVGAPAAGWATPSALPLACTDPQASPFSPRPQQKHVVRTRRRRVCSARVSTGRQGHLPAGKQG